LRALNNEKKKIILVSCSRWGICIIWQTCGCNSSSGTTARVLSFTFTAD